MYSAPTSYPNYSQKYSAIKKTQLLKALKRLEFNGQIHWMDRHEHQWILFLNRGQICYGTGGIHPVRRWKRHLAAQKSQLRLDLQTLEYELSNGERAAFTEWEYQLIEQWMKQQKISESVANRVIQQIVIEVLFDITQAEQVTYQLHPTPPLGATQQPIEIDQEELFTGFQTLWQNWLKTELAQYSPNLAPVIREPEQIQASTSLQTYRMLVALLNGQHTLRDLALKMQRDVIQLAQALQAYVHLNWIELVHIPDFPAPTPLFRPASPPAVATDGALIACIDDSNLVCQSMETTIKAAGYRFIGIMDASRAIATLLAKKPDLIFLDLIMPETNGYEICSQLRKVSLFKETPIIILTGNDGLVDQVRARLLGATDFLSKPMEPAIILSTIQKYLGVPASACLRS